LPQPQPISLASIDEALRIHAENKWLDFYPDTGPLRRELYPKHVNCFAAGKTHRERMFIAANRIGKTEGVGAYEIRGHLTGVHPSWWPGRVFDRPTKVWCAGESAKKVREVVQEKLFGPVTRLGTGMIPADLIVDKKMKSGVPDAIDTAWIRHTSGEVSHLTFKSYEQGREGFDGDEVDVVWLDEEPSLSIYTECLLRTMTCDGIVLLTFTPLKGISELVKAFLPGGKVSGEANS
jgi:phage terminase large subunit-like protein